ncbi:MAG: UDP-2,4-diacetamido-2,4,6-trideoxy-beta-L-altropyranose hydrolase [Thermodesulfovibrionales bacterium]|nr:UDP-2,4-diacetamido-2,4,6-trideoxy-beta-L-altropyranose hydrolase [Thermodesulfovibrionales bacterium]
MSAEKVLIRVDASAAIGMGHVMRCIAFAQGISGMGFEPVFATRTENNSLLEKIKKEGFRAYPLKNGGGDRGNPDELKGIIGKEKPLWVVLDGYHFGTDYQKAIKDMGHRLLVIDDMAHLTRYHADIILNQNYGAERLIYKALPETRFLFGPKYALLRKEFLHYGDFKREIPQKAEKLLVTMGGADADNCTGKVLRSLKLIDLPLHVKVVVGASNPHYESLKSAAPDSRHRIEFVRNVEDMSPLMAWADIAVSAGGTTTWELAFMGLPTALCIIADNQEPAVRALEKDGFFASAGRIGDKTEKELSSIIQGIIDNSAATLSEKGKRLVDGYGALRAGIELIGGGEVALRRDFDFGPVRFVNFINLTPEEKEAVLGWRNSDEIRKWMFTSHIISKKEHLRFIEGLREDGRNFYWMAKVGGKASGVGSFQKVDAETRSGHLGIYSVERGAGRTIMQRLLCLWFDILKMRVLKSELIEGNERAHNFYEDFQFKAEGVARSIEENGVTKKVITMTKTKESISNAN